MVLCSVCVSPPSLSHLLRSVLPVLSKQVSASKHPLNPPLFMRVIVNPLPIIHDHYSAQPPFYNLVGSGPERGGGGEG